ncbi:MAG: class I SAM-dependent methyltransferase [Deltaproteobacteria bacterium]|nr:class I SAM-dependent methyltransferase [Deltaproteobacteria bacterium]
MERPAKREIERIREVYGKRTGISPRYSLFNSGELYAYQQRERGIIQALKDSAFESLSGKRILDLGCGNGNILRDFLRYGASPRNLFGIDLLEDRLTTAKRICPNISFILGSGEALPHVDRTFDLIICFTVFSSILDDEIQKNLAEEVLRVLKEGGAILWLDFFISHPLNPDTRGVSKRRIRALFPNCQLNLTRSILAPIIYRRLVPYSWLAALFLEKLKIFNTYYLGLITKPK